MGLILRQNQGITGVQIDSPRAKIPDLVGAHSSGIAPRESSSAIGHDDAADIQRMTDRRNAREQRPHGQDCGRYENSHPSHESPPSFFEFGVSSVLADWKSFLSSKHAGCQIPDAQENN
jgi:hypothetical protein